VAFLHRIAVLALTATLPVAALVACGDDTPSFHAPPNDDDDDRVRALPGLGPTPAPEPDATPTPTPPAPDAACNVIVESPSMIPANHLPEGTPIAYTSNPPSSGPHYPRWANFQEYAEPVPNGYLVHALEHGAVLLAYNCAALDAGDCAEAVAQLRAVRDAIATDPSCDPSIRVRIILAPMPELDVPFAAAAWGFTYKAACFDAPTLTQFVREHYAKSPEDFCAPGITVF
jgi:Protein of unknown function (DUF3105)